MDEKTSFPPIVIKALRHYRDDKLSLFGCTGGLMMSNNAVRAACEEIDEVNEILRSQGERIPEVTDRWVLDVMSRRDLPPSDQGRALLFGGW